MCAVEAVRERQPCLQLCHGYSGSDNSAASERSHQCAVDDVHANSTQSGEVACRTESAIQ
jgi:hypothetical protein